MKYGKTLSNTVDIFLLHNIHGTEMASDESDSGHFSSAYGLETKDQTLAHYRSWAETYDKEVGEENKYAQPRRVAEMLSRFLSNKSAHILDAGCGSGLSGVALTTAGYKNLDGCDFSPEMLEKSREKACYKSLHTVDLNKGQQSVSDNHYDAVTCVGVFSFGHVLPDACDDIVRILKPGGYLIIALNAPFWEKGDLSDKLTSMEVSGKIRLLAKELGEHLPGHHVMGWVIAAQKSG